MLIELMLFCAAAGLLLIALGAFSELNDLWVHPDHRISEEESRAEKHRARILH
jgi:hypothetical protein